MRRVPSRVGSWALACLGVLLAAQQGASGQTLTPLRDYVGWTSTDLDLWVGDVTPDFGVMVGYTYPSLGPIEDIIYARQPIRWTGESGAVQLPLPPGLTGGAAWKVSDDGSIVTIEAWGPPLDFSGNRRFYLCRWSGAIGTVVLLDLSNTENAMFFRNVSGDGRTLIGSVDASIYGYRPFRWTSEQGLQFLRPITGDWIAWAQLVNHDASIVVGYDESAESGLFAGLRRMAWRRCQRSPTGRNPDSFGWGRTRW